MNAWGVFALIVIAVPTVAVVVWVLREQQSARSRQRFLARYPNVSVAGIRERVERERAEQKRAEEELPQEDTDVLPATVRPDDVPTDAIPALPPLPRRKRRYIDNPPSPRPRVTPDQELMRSIRDGLKRLE